MMDAKPDIVELLNGAQHEDRQYILWLCERAADEILALRARVEKAEADAERYRWLRHVSHHRGDYIPAGMWDKLGDALDDDFDAIIDAARSDSAAGGEG